MIATDVRSEQRAAIAAIVLLGVIATLVLVDVIGDWLEGADVGHVALELAAATLALIALVGAASRALRLARQARGLRAANDELAESNAVLSVALDVSRQETERFRAESHVWRAEARSLIEGLGAAIDRQFDRWELSAAEREVALLLLKGLSHREIAGIRGVGEVTVRQQARTLYRKSGLTGRADLAAFFLEDLLSPTPAATRPSSVPRDESETSG